ncbi:MAG: hypothetical protein CME68_03935 [Halobacteriovoraceae bacterium]|nr:hypothetical protein [Halobacteriovoraceae bacterium]
MLKLSNLLKFTLFIFIGQNLFSAEVDNFRGRYEDIPDMRRTFNKKTIFYFKKGIKELNKKSHKCEAGPFYKKMRRYFRNHMTGKFNKWMLTSKDVHVVYTKPKDSIYKYWNTFESFPIKLLSPIMFQKPAGVLAGYVKVGPVLLGTDKFEHFLGTGFTYFKSYFIKKKTINQTAQIGWRDEVGPLGGMTVGVMSFGDLAAEFNGMFFWNDLLRFHDSLTDKKRSLRKKDFVRDHRNGPYIICKNNKWQLNKYKPFDWAHYLDDSMDEAINCSLFKTKSMGVKVKKSLRELERKKGIKFKCPMDPEKFERLKRKYGKYAPLILNESGHGPITKEIRWRKWRKINLDTYKNPVQKN